MDLLGFINGYKRYLYLIFSYFHDDEVPAEQGTPWYRTDPGNGNETLENLSQQMSQASVNEAPNELYGLSLDPVNERKCSDIVIVLFFVISRQYRFW